MAQILQGFQGKHDAVITVIVVRQYGTRWTLKLKPVQKSSSEHENCFFSKRFSRTRALTRWEWHDTPQTQSTLTRPRTALAGNTENNLPSNRDRGPKINKDGHVPREGTFPTWWSGELLMEGHLPAILWTSAMNAGEKQHWKEADGSLPKAFDGRLEIAPPNSEKLVLTLEDKRNSTVH